MGCVNVLFCIRKKVIDYLIILLHHSNCKLQTINYLNRSLQYSDLPHRKVVNQRKYFGKTPKLDSPRAHGDKFRISGPEPGTFSVKGTLPKRRHGNTDGRCNCCT